ncbi:MAG: bifunctional 4-hydroxy-2-oxoglutarate aldolase/2-dehydro-3-deoxy-phosphogluconate aldolase [Kiritimatiellae bacterium]|jgi:2-dehydro-3-deoxyphosphogluconate aldolase/(4S)-4-hydroxy-2-oxoglutarate aldolase|nr:bifunctional 4-hydroxy-2-oxoglutarate aldolase/2-dehydro-3-deoxy-phosphogluconate aldolase [Kiritimatiellia bacterium]
MSLEEIIKEIDIFAVLEIDNANDAVRLAETLLEGGISAMELTLRTPAALDALQAILEEVPEMIAGVGTILTPEQVREVKKIGARFGVAPGLNRNVMKEAIKQELPFAPGVATPSDIESALELGYHTMKFFPAEPQGGLTYLNSMAAPYKFLGLQFIPLGGVNEENLRTYLESPLICAVGGSWIAKRDLIQNKNWAEIKQRALIASTIAKEVKEETA